MPVLGHVGVSTAVQNGCSVLVSYFQYGLNTDSGLYTREACFKGMNGSVSVFIVCWLRTKSQNLL